MRRGCWGIFAAVLFGSGCGGGGGSERPELTGNLKVTVAPPAFDGVAGVRINVITIMHDCGDRGIAEQIVLMDGTQPANAFFVVPADRYTVCLTALDSQEQPLPNCSGGAGGVVVTDNLTTEVSAVLNCHEPRGAIDVTVGFNATPVINSVILEPGGPFSTCDIAEILVDASDPEQDQLTYDWFVGRYPFGSNPRLGFVGPRAFFQTDVPGDYEAVVVVGDGKGGTSLRIPLHVTACP